ncbi:MAG TPA: hypothetical protein VMY37_30815 [Thermoguttaceae bacterium]|nr:hypothetical protein [Thermoguttaceae bacterium]
MATINPDNGWDVLDTATGAGGIAINENFKQLADILDASNIGSGHVVVGYQFNFQADNRKLYWGTDDDACVYYDGTNLVVDPDAVGSGLLVIDGSLRSDTFKTDDTATGGTENTFVGQNAAGAGNNTARGGTLVGYRAGNSITTGAFNVFVGPHSGQAANVAAYNVAIGRQAMFYNQSGGYNVCVGYNAGFGASGGDHGANVFVGGRTAESNSTGGDNVCVGYFAGIQNQTGNYNVCVGSRAGYGTASNSYGSNTFVGYRAGLVVSTGGNNVCIGTNSGRNVGAGTGNVFVGYTAGYNETGSNKLYIDNSNTGPPLIYGEFDNDFAAIHGDLGIGSTAQPTANKGKVLFFGDNGAEPTMASNTAGLYAQDIGGTVAMFAVDEAGNEQQLTPHDPNTGEWIFYSKNLRTGRVVRVRMERLLQRLNEMFGEVDWFHESLEATP